MIYWTINGDEDSVFHTHGYVAMPAKALLNCALAQDDAGWIEARERAGF
jgi:hypothetical protein